LSLVSKLFFKVSATPLRCYIFKRSYALTLRWKSNWQKVGHWLMELMNIMSSAGAHLQH